MVFFGPAAEKYGRKKIMCLGIMIICAGSIGAILAQTWSQLLAFRILQGLGVSATVLMGRTMINDLFSGRAAVKTFSLVMLAANLIISFLPTMAGCLTQFGNYKIPFAIIVFYTALLTIIALFSHDTKKTQTDFLFSLKKTPMYYWRILRNRTFLGYILCAIFVVAAEAAFDTASPLILMNDFHMSPKHFGFLITAASFLSWIGILGSGLLVKRLSTDSILGIGATLSLVASLMILLQLFVFAFSIIGFVTSLAIFFLGIGFILTTYNVGVVQAHPHMIAVASSASLFLYFASSSLGSFMISHFSTHTILPLAMTISILAGLVFFAWLFLIKLLPIKQYAMHNPVSTAEYSAESIKSVSS